MNIKIILLTAFLLWNTFSVQSKELEWSLFDTFPKSELHTQSTYKGYVVTTNNDTIIGYIKMLSPIYNSIRVQFIHATTLQSETFKSEELLSYAFKVNNPTLSTDEEAIWMKYEKHYIHQPSIPFGTNEVLLYKAQSGDINLYHHFYENSKNTEEPIKATFFIKTKEGQLIHITKANYKLVLSDLMNNSTTHNSLKESYYEDVEQLIKFYNKEMKSIKAD